jgi:hypothetical protein
MLWARLKAGTLLPEGFIDVVRGRIAELTGRADLRLMHVSHGKGIGHWFGLDKPAVAGGGAR